MAVMVIPIKLVGLNTAVFGIKFVDSYLHYASISLVYIILVITYILLHALYRQLTDFRPGQQTRQTSVTGGGGGGGGGFGPV